jgi:hypothetical protein
VDKVDEGVAALGQDLSLSKIAVEMLPGEDLSDYFSVALQQEHLHVIVQRPTTPPQPALQKTPTNQSSNSLNVKPIPPSASGNSIHRNLIEERQKLIDKYVSNLRPRIKEFLSNLPLPNWMPPESVNDETREFYSGLAIPFVGEKPNLLLHDIGNIPNPNVDDLFNAKHHR